MTEEPNGVFQAQLGRERVDIRPLLTASDKQQNRARVPAENLWHCSNERGVVFLNRKASDRHNDRPPHHFKFRLHVLRRKDRLERKYAVAHHSHLGGSDLMRGEARERSLGDDNTMGKPGNCPRIFILLAGIGEQIGEMFRSDDRDAVADALLSEVVPFPADACVDMQQVNAGLRQPIAKIFVAFDRLDRQTMPSRPKELARATLRDECQGDVVGPLQRSAQRKHMHPHPRGVETIGGQNDASSISHIRRR
ncbi:hypothetical protein GGD55_002526 [Rhizobium giardinii]|uniref:Uncharacterized protein n=1 Tax=Rhizobium giardinii TaxID=56731 RepID=A0A7W8UAJ4_9HYPH|nr:hypothetical protein [Rhizobium giardinii]